MSGCGNAPLNASAWRRPRVAGAEDRNRFARTARVDTLNATCKAEACREDAENTEYRADRMLKRLVAKTLQRGQPAPESKTLRLQRDLDNVLSSYQSLQRDLSETLAAHQLLQRDLGDALSTKQGIQSDLDEARSAKQSLEQDLQDALAANGEIRRSLDEALAANQSLQSNLNDALSTNQSYLAEMDRLRTELDRLRTELERLHGELARLQGELAPRDQATIEYAHVVAFPTPQQAEARGPIAILGHDIDTPAVLQSALAVGFTPVLLHAADGSLAAGSRLAVSSGQASPPGPGEDGKVELDVVGGEEFARIISERRIPILAGAYGIRDRNFFRDTLLYARNRIKLDAAVVHPAALCDFHSNAERRYAIIGFPGSGNMIVQNVLSRLRTQAAAPPGDQLSNAMTGFALSYWSTLRDCVTSAFDEAGRWVDLAGPSHQRHGALYIGLRDQDAPTVVAGLPQRAYAWSNPWYTSHEPLTKGAVAFFIRQNFAIVQILRHPLDLIVSNAAKITVAAGDRAPQLLLQNDRWMETMLEAVEAYYACIVEQQGAAGVLFLKYEDLMAAPIPAIRALAEIVGVPCDDELAVQVWEDLSGKQLSETGHYWRPGAGKWREFIPPRFQERIRSSRLRDYAEAAGYHFEVEGFHGSRSEVPSNTTDPLNLAWQDARWESSTGKQPALHHPGVYRMHDPQRGLLMVGARQHEHILDGLGRSQVLRDLIAASRIEARMEPPLIAECIGLRSIAAAA